MESDRDGDIQFGEPRELQTHDGISMKSEHSPSLAYFNGRVWLAYRSREGKVLVGCRVGFVPGIKNLVYQEYDLQAVFHGRGNSGAAPSLTEFNGRLYVFWKTNLGNEVGDIVYTSTEDGQDWAPLGITPFQTLYAPTVCHYRDHVYLVFRTQKKEIQLASSLDGENKWSPARSLRLPQGSQSNISSPNYTPVLIDQSGRRLTMYWGGDQSQSDAVFYADLDTAAIDTATGTFVHPLTGPHKIDDGKWQTKIGNTGVYGKTNQYIITTTKNGEISLAYNDNFESRANLSSGSGVKSGATVSACPLPGYFGRKYQEEWGLVLVYRGYKAGGSNDLKLYELSVIRSNASREETLIQDLTDQLDQALKGKAAAEADRDEYKKQNQQLQGQISTLGGTITQLQGSIATLHGTITTLQGTVTTLQEEKSKASTSGNAEVEQLRGLLDFLRINCDHGKTCAQGRIDVYNVSIDRGDYPGRRRL